VLVAAAAILVTAPCASAQLVSAPSDQPTSSQEISPVGPYQEGATLGGWMLFPSIFVGGTYDTNHDQSAPGTDRDSGGAVRVAPRLVATHTDGGIHSTAIYGVGDFRFFNADTISADAGITHTYQPLPDLTLNGNFRYTRQTDLFTSALNFNNNAIGPAGQGGPAVTPPPIINPFGTTPIVNPIAYNQFTAGGSVEKTFGQGFASITATAFHIAYDHSDDVLPPFNTSHDGTAIWLTGRVGYHFVPSLYGFAEVTGVWQRFNNSIFDTNGYRILGGLGTDEPNSLVRGEVYGGYQFQHQNQDLLVPGFSQNSDSGVFGGRVYYYPTRYWTLIASVDEALSMSTFLQPNLSVGSPVLVTTAILQTTYALSQQWSIGARVGYTRADYFDIDRLDNGWMAGASFNYQIWRNLNLTLDYQYSTVDSNVPGNDFSRNVYTAGLTYRY
jgi:hypothetical protein